MRSTLMTSNRPLEDRGKLVGDAPSVTAMLDRLLENSEVIQVTGKSDRLRGPEVRVRELGGANWKTPANARG
ncbi:MAG: ATP-binding protein, partial [Planctomycetaceae bacterium]